MNFISSFLLVSLSSLILSACTFNVSMAHTQGTATDTIDDTASNQPNVSPSLTVPVKGV